MNKIGYFFYNMFVEINIFFVSFSLLIITFYFQLKIFLSKNAYEYFFYDKDGLTSYLQFLAETNDILIKILSISLAIFVLSLGGYMLHFNNNEGETSFDTSPLFISIIYFSNLAFLYCVFSETCTLTYLFTALSVLLALVLYRVIKKCFLCKIQKSSYLSFFIIFVISLDAISLFFHYRSNQIITSYAIIEHKMQIETKQKIQTLENEITGYASKELTRLLNEKGIQISVKTKEAFLKDITLDINAKVLKFMDDNTESDSIPSKTR